MEVIYEKQFQPLLLLRYEDLKIAVITSGVFYQKSVLKFQTISYGVILGLSIAGLLSLPQGLELNSGLMGIMT